MNGSFKIGAFAIQILLILSLLSFAFGKTSASSVEYREALERYHAAFRNLYKPGSITMSVPPYFGLEHWNGATNLNSAVSALASIGANMIPFMVEQIRGDFQAFNNEKGSGNEKGQIFYYGRLDKNVELMFLLGGIQIRIGMGPVRPGDSMIRIEKWLKEWDSGVFERLEPKLREIRKESNEEQNPSTVDYRKTFPYRVYGVYALPFLIKEIRANNSAECFNAFLIITFHRDLYVKHYEHPKQFYPTVTEKISFIQEWWSQNKQKFSELKKLSKKIEISLK